MKRWVIRSFFIGLLLLCVGGWVGSERYDYGFDYLGRDLWGVTCNRGRIQLQWWDFSSTTSAHRFSGHLGPAYDLPSSYFAQFDSHHSGLGFFMTNGSTTKLIIIPFAYPSLLSGIILLFAWRKTPPKPDPKSAFPVEAKQAV